MKPLWRGPQKDGITFSMLSNFLVCRHRFWIKYVLGLSPVEEFKHAMEYGNFWHEAEEASGHGKNPYKAIKAHALKLRQQYPGKEKEIDKWAAIAAMQFRVYLDLGFAKKRKDRKYIATEHAFRVKYEFDGRFVYLRGKIDRLMEKYKITFIEEHKTKGTIDVEAISQSLHHNMQVMMYHIAARNLKNCKNSDRKLHGLKPRGTYYNVIRRPLSDRFAIRQKKTETDKQFIARLEKNIREKKDYYFMEFPATIKSAQVEQFKDEFLHSVLHQLCDWWNSIKGDPEHPFKSKLHYRFPFGVYNSLTGGFRGDYYEMITKGSMRNLKETVLFRELIEE